MSDTTKTMYSLPPKRLYKYFSISGKYEEYSRQLLTDCQIYFTSPDDFNDPFDCAVTFSSEGTKEYWRKYILEHLKRNEPDMHPMDRAKEATRWVNRINYKLMRKDFVANITKSWGVYCLSACPDDILMWSHYANKHRGYVIEFDQDYNPFGFTRGVNYVEKYEQLSIFQDDQTRLKLTLLTKSERWKYEQEFRAIQTSKFQRQQRFSASSLSGIYFGCKMTKENKEKVREFIAKGHCKPSWHEYERNETEYKLDLHDLD